MDHYVRACWMTRRARIIDAEHNPGEVNDESDAIGPGPGGGSTCSCWARACGSGGRDDEAPALAQLSFIA
jgi:hypothetical protein